MILFNAALEAAFFFSGHRFSNRHAAVGGAYCLTWLAVRTDSTTDKETNMPQTKLTELIPANWIEPLIRLGRSDCARISKHPSGEGITTTVDWNELDEIVDNPEISSFAGFVLGDAKCEGIQLLALAKLLANGPKIVQPTTDDCIGLNRVDARLTIREYKQPFPVMLVEIPEEFRQTMTEEYETLCPKLVLLMHDSDLPYLAIFTMDERGADMCSISHHREHKSIESVLRVSSLDDARFRQSVNLHRIAVNLALLLTNYGYVNAGPLEPKQFNRNKKLLKSKSPMKRIQARNQLDRTINLIRIEQEITWSNGASASCPNPASGGTSKTPHWRRGYIRRQRFGVGRKQERFIFIKAVFINSRQFGGEASDTEYRIKVDRKGEEDKYRPCERKRLPEPKLDRQDDGHRN